MTDEEIDKLEPGGELDVLVAKAVYGWEPRPDHPVASPFSQRIHFAWSLLPSFEAGGCTCEAFGQMHEAHVHYPVVIDGERLLLTAESWAETAPLAICRVVLKARLGAKRHEEKICQPGATLP